MARQLVLLDTTGADWRLDQHTREIGRRGVAEARIILQRALDREREHEATRGPDGGADRLPPYVPAA